MKPKVAFFSFSSCEGCQLQVLNLEEELPTLLGFIEIVNFREAIDEKRDDYDIAFIEGSITRESDIVELKEIRTKAKILVAFGACADLGGVNALKNFHPQDSWLPAVYNRTDFFDDTMPTNRVKDIVPVDFVIPGCPIDKGEFLRFVQSLLLGVQPRIPDYPVCVECRSRGNVCLVEEGKWCLGSVTRAGCGAICPTFRDPCAGCRGLTSAPNIESLVTILMEKGYSKEDIRDKFRIFNGLEAVSGVINVP